MKKEKEKANKKIKEPYEPNDTPKPPHIIDPNSRRERENPIEGSNRPDDREENRPKTSEGKAHLLSDESDIDDETTI